MLSPSGSARPIPLTIPGRNSIVQAEGVADGDGKLSNLHFIRVGEGKRWQLFPRVNLQHGDVRACVLSD